MWKFCGNGSCSIVMTMSHISKAFNYLANQVGSVCEKPDCFDRNSNTRRKQYLGKCYLIACIPAKPSTWCKTAALPRKEPFRRQKIMRWRNSCRFSAARPFCVPPQSNLFLPPSKTKLNWTSVKTKTLSQGYLASGNLINLNVAELCFAIYTLAVCRANFMFHICRVITK